MRWTSGLFLSLREHLRQIPACKSSENHCSPHRLQVSIASASICRLNSCMHSHDLLGRKPEGLSSTSCRGGGNCVGGSWAVGSVILGCNRGLLGRGGVGVGSCMGRLERRILRTEGCGGSVFCFKGCRRRLEGCIFGSEGCKGLFFRGGIVGGLSGGPFALQIEQELRWGPSGWLGSCKKKETARLQLQEKQYFVPVDWEAMDY